MNHKRTSHTHSTTKRGFTLVETLMSVLILAFVITGPMAFTAQSIKAAMYARDQVVAFYLTQEAVELVKNARDNKGLAAVNGECEAQNANSAFWLSCYLGGGDLLLSSCMPTNSSPVARYCAVGLDSASNPVVLPCSGGPLTCPELSRSATNATGLFYAYPTSPSAAWIPSGYRRVVSIMPVPGREAREAEITVSIYWKSGTIDREFTVRQNITNWLPLGPIF